MDTGNPVNPLVPIFTTFIGDWPCGSIYHHHEGYTVMVDTLTIDGLYQSQFNGTRKGLIDWACGIIKGDYDRQTNACAEFVRDNVAEREEWALACLAAT